MSAVVSVSEARRSRVRLFIVTMLFLVTTVNYADRATLSIAGPALSKELGLDPIAMGYVFSAFGWSYVVAQVPGGWLLDRYGSRWVYAFSIMIWSLFTLMQGFVGFFVGGAAITMLFMLRLAVGFAEAPSFPANARIVAAWFPGNERGTASAFFNSGQYFATVIFAPLMGWIAHDFGWRYVFVVMGALGVVMGAFWIKTMYGPKDHPSVNEAEFDYIRDGGALVDLDAPKAAAAPDSGPKWDHIRQLLANRMMLGVYIGQYCINTLTYFFLTWFPVYLVKERGLSILQAGFVATLPALCGFIGGVLGGVISDYLLKRTGSLTPRAKFRSWAACCCRCRSSPATMSTGRRWWSASWRSPSSARASARSAGRSCPTPRRRKPAASPAGCSTPSATFPASPRRSSSATSWRRPVPSTVRWCSSASTRWWRPSLTSSSWARSSGCSCGPRRLAATAKAGGGRVGRRLCFRDNRC
jgi:ACS family glucarate transporter-like MFS transporter